MERTATLYGTLLNLSVKALYRSHYVQLQIGDWSTVARVAAGYNLGGSGFESQWRQETLSSALASVPALGPTQLRANWVSGIFSGGKMAGGWPSPPTPSSDGGSNWVEQYLYFPSAPP